MFDIKTEMADTWVECLTRRLGKPLQLENGKSLQFKMEDFKIPRLTTSTKTNYGSVTITVWPNPKTTHPKIMVQGKCHMAFLTFIAPLILQDIKKVGKLSITGHAAPLELTESSDEEEPSSQEHLSFSKALGRLEKEVLNLREDMAERIDTALTQQGGASAIKGSSLDKRLDSLEKLLADNTSQHARLVTSIDQLRDSITRTGTANNIQLDNQQLDKLVTDISKSQVSQASSLTSTVAAIRAEMAASTTLTAVHDKVENLTSVLDQVQTTVLKIDKNVSDVKKDVTKVSEVTNDEMVLLRKNSDNSLKMFETMITSLRSIEAKSTSKASLTNPLSPSTVTTQGPTEVPLRRGIMFASSIALDTDTKRYKDELNCELKIIPTDNVEEDPCATDPDSHLGGKINQHLKGKTGYSFAILATGTNEITNIDTENSPATTMFTKVSSQSQTLFDIAESITKEMDIDVFVVDKPPRYDKTGDPTGMKQKLTKYSNGVLASSTGATPRIFLVEQGSLARAAIRARADIFQQDGLHLTPKGLNFYNTNILNVMRECYPEVQTQQALKGRGGDGGNQDTPQHVQGDRGNNGRGVGRNQGFHSQSREPPYSQFQRGGQGRNGGGRSGKQSHHREPNWVQPPGWAGQRREGWSREGYYWGPPHPDFGGGYPRRRF